METLMYETWETKCPKCGFIFGGRITQLDLPKPMTMTCSHCSARFIPNIVSPAGCIEDKETVKVRLNILGNSRRIQDEEREKIRLLRKSGMTISKIANEIKRSKCTVRKILKEAA